MKPFAYERTEDSGAAASLVAKQPDAMFLAGGTNLVDLMKLGVAEPSTLVDVTKLGYDRIEHRDDGGVLIGATVPNSELAGDPGIRQRFPVLSQAILAGASGQLRSAATTAGNLLQRTRCVYFQDITKPCNKREPGSGCPAIEGAHRDLGVLGTSDHCVATYPGDMAVALVALDAVVHVRSPEGHTRTLPLEDLYVLPGDTPQRENVLERGELITDVELPAAPAGAAMRYRKVRDRWSYAFALVSVAATVRTDDEGVIDELRLALGGVAPRPWRARTAEAELVGTRPTPENVERAMGAELARARPLPDNAFKLDLATDLVGAVLRDLTESEEDR